MCMAFDKTQSPQHRGMIQEWLEYVSTNTMWCKSYMFSIAGYTFLAVSSPQSTRQGTDNVFRNLTNAAVLTPAWYHYQVYRYVGLSVLNFHGIIDSEYEGTLLADSLGDFVRRQYEAQGKAYVQGPILGGHDADSLRYHFGELGIKCWVEITTGLSYVAYRGLDVYIKVPTTTTTINLVLQPLSTIYIKVLTYYSLPYPI